jgi:V/A-type H+/Na+-transporting ATPase subunit F
MRIFAISDENDALTGLRLAGIEGKFAETKREVEECVNEVLNNSDIAVILITESCAALIPEMVKKVKLSYANPLLVVIPGSNGSNTPPDSITRLISEAIGIKK